MLMRLVSTFWLTFTAGPLSAEGNPRLEFARGVLAESRGEASAAGHFEKARLADPLALPLVQRAVDRCMVVNDRAGAVKLLRDLAAARPDDVHVQLTYVKFLIRQGQGDTMASKIAASVLESVLAKHPGHPEATRQLHGIYLEEGRKFEALALLDRLATDDPASALLYTALARGAADADDAAQRGRMDRHYQEALAATPENPDLAREASEHFRNSGRLEKAIEILEKHTAAAPSSLALRTRLGILLFSAKQHAQGESRLKEVLAIHPQQALAHQALAKFYRSRGQLDPVRFHSGELLKIRGGAAADFVRLADEWLAAGDPREARLLLERAVFAHPAHWESQQKLAIATRRDAETRGKAVERFREAEASRPADVPEDPEFLFEFAESLIDGGQSAAAEDRLRQAIRAYPAEAKKQTATALRRLAALWEAEDRNAEAARALRQRADALDR
jgi:predicted Zn-dependent protease